MSTGRPLRILVADDHEAMRMVIGSVVTNRVSPLAPVEYFSNGDDLLMGLLPERGPAGLLSLDLTMPGFKRRLALLKSVLELAPDLPILVYASNDSPLMMMRAIDMGAMGYVVKGSPFRTLIEGFESVLMHDRFYDPHVDILEAGKHRWWSLSPVERETVVALAKGWTITELAKERGRSYKTIAAHKYNATEKLGITNNTPLAIYLADEGLSFELDD